MELKGENMKVGDRVRIVSEKFKDKPVIMTIVEFSQDKKNAKVNWFNMKNEIMEYVFPIECLCKD